ncbi:hypothetical protein [Tenacibaculum amylolyticum]|uniref:hypothetical protein n=1 Tax=Tenacibaculum amylolyticum TaxID=104269 RepID=UPI0038946883
MSNQSKDNEEVDLGSVLVIIGNAFTRFFNFIGNIFKNLFHFFIEILLFIKSNIIKIGIGALIGAVAGLALEVSSETKYESNLYVKPNFNSSRQLYNNIQFYNDLVKQKNAALLSSIFNITEDEAISLKKFDIKPIINENDILTSYDELLQSIDTATIKSYSYKKFQETFTNFDYKVHQISVAASEKDVFPKLSSAIISSIINNDYFKTLKKINKENLLRTDSLLKKNLQQADSLHYVYKEVLLEEAKKTNAGTTIDLGQSGKGSSNKELELFETSLELNKNLVEINEDLSEKSEIINIVSNFQPIGHKVIGIQKNKAFQFAVMGVVIIISLLLLLKLNRYLNNYKTSSK